MTKSFDDVISNYQDPSPEWTVLINGNDYSNNLELLEFTDSVNNPLKFTVKLGGVKSSDNIPEDSEVIVKRSGGELFRGVLKQVEPNILNTYTFKGTGYSAELEGDVDQKFSATDIQTVVDTLIGVNDNDSSTNTTNTNTPRTFSTSYAGTINNTAVENVSVEDFRAKKTQLAEVNRLMGEYGVEWYTTYDGSNNPVFNVTDQISFTDNGNPLDTLTTYGSQSAEMVKQNANRNKGDFDGVLVRGYGDGDNQITATAGSTGKGNRVLIYTDKTIITSSQAQKRADNINSNKAVSWQEIEVKPSDPNKIYGVGDELKIEAEEARLNDTYRVVETYFKYWPEENEVESRLNLSNKPQTFVEDFRQEQEKTDSQTDYMQGGPNTQNFKQAQNAKSGVPMRNTFELEKSTIEDAAGNIRVPKFEIDYDVDPYRAEYGGASYDGNDPQVQNSSASDTPDVENSSGNDQPGVTDNSGSTEPVVEDTSASSNQDTEANEGRADFADIGDGTTAILRIFTDFVSGGDTDFAILHVHIRVTNNSSSADGYDLEILNEDTNTTYFQESNYIAGDQIGIITRPSDSKSVIVSSANFLATEDLEGDDIAFRLTNQTGSAEDIEIAASVAQVAQHEHAAGNYNAKNHDHDDGTYSATDHDHPDGSYNAETHPHNNGAYDVNSADIDNISIGDDVDEQADLNATGVTINLDYYDGSSWTTKNTITKNTTLERGVDLSDGGTYPDQGGYWRVRVETDSSTPDLVKSNVRLEHPLKSENR